MTNSTHSPTYNTIPQYEFHHLFSKAHINRRTVISFRPYYITMINLSGLGNLARLHYPFVIKYLFSLLAGGRSNVHRDKCVRDQQLNQNTTKHLCQLWLASRRSSAQVKGVMSTVPSLCEMCSYETLIVENNVSSISTSSSPHV